MGAACDYLMGIGMDRVEAYEHQIGEYLYKVGADPRLLQA